MMAVAFRYTSKRSEAEAIVQESFIKLSRILDHFRLDDDEKCRAYLVFTLRSAAVDTMRKNKREMPLEAVSEIPDGLPTPLEEAIRREETSGVWQAVQALDEPFRQVVYCRYYMDMDTRETAAFLKITAHQVYMRLYQAKKLLKKALLAKGIWDET